MPRRLILQTLRELLLLAPAAITFACSPAAPELAPNIILVLTDDQRYDTLWAMPRFMERSLDSRIVFNQAFVSTPMCAPSRACLLSGGYYAHQTHVLTNEFPNGAWEKFPLEEASLPVLIGERGYRTGLVGKYLNYDIDDEIPKEIPRGWNYWWVQTSDSHMYGWQALVGSSDGNGGLATERSWGEDHLVDTMAERAEHFIETSREPFFLYLSPYSPHLPNQSAPEDLELFSDYTYTEGAFNEEDVSDKPKFIKNTPLIEGADLDQLNSEARSQLQLIQPIDRMMEHLYDVLEEQGQADRTWIFFMSDNGVLWGEHRLTGKGVHYDPATRVPLVVSGPGLATTESDNLIAASLDVPATILNLAGVEGFPPGMDLLSPFRDGIPWQRERLLIQSFTGSYEFWSGILSEDWKFVRWGNGESELYDRHADPWELQNLWTPGTELLPKDHAIWLAENEGLILPRQELEINAGGGYFDEEIPVWGGTPPFTWQVLRLPKGLTFENGRIFGTTGPLTFDDSIGLGIMDSSHSPWDDERQSFITGMTLRVVKSSDKEADGSERDSSYEDGPIPQGSY